MEEEVSPQRQLEALRAQLYDWEQLKKSRGWSLVQQYAQRQIDLRFNNIVRAEQFEVSSVIQREYLRGECSGIDLFQRMAEIEIERLQQEIEVVVKQVELEESNYVEVPTPNETAP